MWPKFGRSSISFDPNLPYNHHHVIRVVHQVQHSHAYLYGMVFLQLASETMTITYPSVLAPVFSSVPGSVWLSDYISLSHKSDNSSPSEWSETSLYGNSTKFIHHLPTLLLVMYGSRSTTSIREVSTLPHPGSRQC